MIFQYAWFIWTLAFFALWAIVFFVRRDLRNEMLLISLWTMPLGLTEPLFVPEYWDPPSLFGLAQKTGFDIESLIFCFSIEGVASVIYRIMFKLKTRPFDLSFSRNTRHKYHLFILLLPIPIFILLAVFTKLNHIYCGIISMFIGAVATLYCRPDLTYKIWGGGLIFMLYYSLFFYSLMFLVPNYVSEVWNLSVLSGLFLFKMPIEELLFAFSFGMLWSSLYEHIFWMKLAR